jgi:DNA replication protein DnaC
MELPTIITTNENMENLEFCLGERTTSRISQLCNIYMLYSDTDIRILKSKEKKNIDAPA